MDSRWEIVGEAGDGEEALAILENDPVDLVITDIKMPVMNGLTLTQKLRELYPEQQIAILSGYNEFSLAQQALRYGAAEYLLKPIKTRELIELLAKISLHLVKTSQRDLTLRTLMGFSQDYQKQIARSYLRAIISNSNVEIELYHPLMYRLKIDLVEAVSCILLFRIDPDSLMAAGIPLNHITVYRFMVLQAISEIIESNGKGYVLLDDEENIVVYFTDENEDALQKKYSGEFQNISQMILTKFHVAVSAGFGSMQSEIFEIRASYIEALSRLDGWLCAGGNQLFEKKLSPRVGEILSILRTCGNDILYHANKQEFNLIYGSLRAYIQSLPSDAGTLVRGALYLLQMIQRLDPEKKCFNWDGLFKEFQAESKKASWKTPELIIFLLNSLEKSQFSQPHRSEKDLIESATEFIYQHFTEPITLSQIADALDMSPNYLSKQFHDGMGETYIKFITRLRMEYAAHLLSANPMEKIASIVEKSGYCNINHFNFVFKQYYKVTPGQYQKKRIQEHGWPEK